MSAFVHAARRRAAIAYVRRDLPGSGADLHELAERHGYRLVFTVIADTGPVLSGLIVAQHICEHDAEAVVVPGFQHAEAIRSLVTDLAALVTPMQLYPRGFRWPAVEPGGS
ncbi:hypothetical protein [Nocardia carnea]|uniref:hypothetical protein n=1 Tax=Nocardia carnea TaxID=37328 RepID=UPI00245627E2|nr:hypothetical protein [Nocardia carnea]